MEHKEFLEAHDYLKWEIKDADDYNWEEVIYDGHGYVIMDNKTRFDSSEDLYREERLLWNSLKNKNFLFIRVGRWIITNEGVETKKENNLPIIFDVNQIWSYENKSKFYFYSLPVHLCSKGWISNVDLLDFNSAFLICLEKFENSKPNNFPNISWSETLKRQYKRFQYSLDINSFEGRKQFEYEQEYRKTLSFEEMHQLAKVDISDEYRQEIEVFGDALSRKP